MTSDPKTTAMKAHSQPAIIARIDARLKALGVSEKRAMLVKALPEDRIRRLRQGTAPRLDTLEEVAFALDWTLGQMLGFEPVDEALPNSGVQLEGLDAKGFRILKGKSTSISGWKRHLDELGAHLQQLEDRVAARESEAGWKEGLKLAAALRGHIGGIAAQCASAQSLLPRPVVREGILKPEDHILAAVHLCEKSLGAIRQFEVRLRMGAEASAALLPGASSK